MMQKIKVQISKEWRMKLEKGYPMLEDSTVLKGYEQFEEGAILTLHHENKYIATAYYGRQNKGYGWILSNEQEEIDQAFFQAKIIKAIAKRQSFKEDATSNAYRIFNGEGDGIGGLTIDFLDGHYLVTWYSLGIYQFKSDVLEVLKGLPDMVSIYEKKRFDSKGQYISDDDFVYGDKPEFPILVKENNVTFPVYLNDGPMIGFFLDQKDVRQKLKTSYVKNKTVLNTFSYTGAFSVYAALGGAKMTTSVDLAKRSLPRTKELFEVNGIDSESQQIIVEDVFNYFKYAVRKQLLFDVVILDPPSFARSKKRTFSVAKDYSKLMEEAIAITKKGGLIVASTNYSNGDMNWFKKQMDKAFNKSNTRYKIEECYQLPKDFVYNHNLKSSNYLKVLFLRKI